MGNGDVVVFVTRIRRTHTIAKMWLIESMKVLQPASIAIDD